MNENETPETDKSIRTFQTWDVPSCRHVMVEYVFVHTAKKLERERDEAVDIARKVMETVMQIYGHAQFCDQCQSFEIAKQCRDELHGFDRTNSLHNDNGDGRREPAPPQQ